MKLRCLVSPNRHIVVGRRYEVAEILELPSHAMVRKPNGKWPVPGDPYFGMHADEYFESPSEGIAAISCGFNHVEDEFFSVVIPNSIFPTPRQAFNGKPTEDRDRVLEIVDSVAGGRLWCVTYHGVLTKVCWPEELEGNFIVLGIKYGQLGRGISYRAATAAIRTVMRRLKISSALMPVIEDQQLEFWTRSWRKAGAWRWTRPRVGQ